MQVQPAPAGVTREDQYVAALCHMSASFLFFGLLVPLIVWVSRRERSLLLRFQALQALIFQVTGTLMYFGLFFLQGLLWFGAMFFMFFIGIVGGSLLADSSGTPPQGGELFGVVFLIGFILVFVVVFGLQMLQLLLIPVMTISGIWGAWRSIQGRPFRYPLLGKWLVRRLTPKPPPNEPLTETT